MLDCGPRLAELVTAASNLKLVATSREPLRLTLEQQYPVPPLPEDDARTLFDERARSVRPDFAANGAVAEICRRLDGLPLAIELAAARVKILPPDALLARLEQRLPLLAGGARDAPERQQTLRAAIAWSYDLLEEHEQQALARLSVFAGGWTLEAAEAVCECDLDTLASLVDKSLVREREGRFSMLETIREFARERLAEREPGGDSLRRHAEYFLEQATGARRSAASSVDMSLRAVRVVRAGARQPSGGARLVARAGVGREPELRFMIASVGILGPERLLDRGTPEVRGCARPRRRGSRGRCEPERNGASRSVVARQGDYARGKELAESAIRLYEASGTEPD